MKKTNIDWQKEFDGFSKSGLSQPQYCKERRLKYTTFHYHWERRFKKQDKDGSSRSSYILSLGQISNFGFKFRDGIKNSSFYQG
ncbi:hypothetical protein FH581_013335 [Leptospira weilii]|uniref:IS66 family insertion sequence element accessory protein TnpA n=1 Tax=Leptospira weilii TaxID=28184 RepID=UPI001EF23244|nr:hypothetical protein [Leptospira weilii]ULH28056.1 hypothetical protein FH586_17055 [Leptospira weilii]UPY76921.1 hypothetical protein FH581_013335 [Leptospira weilii]